jgi:hypothetical protein
VLPEQQRALDYIARHGTGATVEALRAKLRSAFTSIEERFATLPAERRAWIPAPGKWGPSEIVDHLILSHEPVIEQLETLLAGRDVEGEAVPAGIQSPAGTREPWPELFEHLRDVHRRLVAVVEAAPDEASLVPTAPVEMVVKAAGVDGTLAPVHWFERLDWKAVVQVVRVHTLEHREQLERVLGAENHAPHRERR